MVELTEEEKRVVEAMKMLKATAEDKLKTADHIAKAAMLPKGKVANLLMSLSNKKVIKRIVREKAAGYYLVEG
ncbi:MAG: transcriptional regulator [Candidatus Aenigmatarchaeota archaeon]